MCADKKGVKHTKPPRVRQMSRPSNIRPLFTTLLHTSPRPIHVLYNNAKATIATVATFHPKQAKIS